MLHQPAISLASTRPFVLGALQFSGDLNGPPPLHSDNHTECGPIMSVPSQRTYSRRRAPAVFVKPTHCSLFQGRGASGSKPAFLPLFPLVLIQRCIIQEKFQHHEQGFEGDCRISIGKVILTDLGPRARGLSPKEANVFRQLIHEKRRYHAVPRKGTTLSQEQHSPLPHYASIASGTISNPLDDIPPNQNSNKSRKGN